MTLIPGGDGGSSDLETVVKGENLEVIVGEETYVNLFGQKIKLNCARPITPNGPNEIQIEFHFGTYKVGNYKTYAGSRKAFQKYSSMLEEGYLIKVYDNGTAKFIRKKVD